VFWIRLAPIDDQSLVLAIHDEISRPNLASRPLRDANLMLS
jgi:hypothetical protein